MLSSFGFMNFVVGCEFRTLALLRQLFALKKIEYKI